MKFLVVGSNSFSGASFIKYLLEKEIETVGISRSPEYDSVFLPYQWENSSGFTFYQMDLNRDLDGIMDVVRKFKPTHIVNYASQSMVAQSWENPEHWFQTNVVATVNFHDALRKVETLEKYVHISTPEVYGNTQGVIKESRQYAPSTPYAVSRACADMSLISFYDTYQFPVVFTRAANVYGPGQQLYRIIPRAILFFLTGRTIELHGGGESVRSFIHIRDVSEGTFQVATKAAPPEIFHLSTDAFISIRALVEKIAQMVGGDVASLVKPVGERPGKDSRYTLDCSKAEDQLGWQPQISIEQGVRDTVEWVKTYLDVLEQMPLDYQHKP